MKHYKVIDGILYAVSLVEDPAMESMFVAMSKQMTRIQLEEEKRLITGAALIPDKPIYRYVNGEEFMMEFDRASIEYLSSGFLAGDLQVTVGHKEETPDIIVVESWIKTTEEDKSVALGLNEPIGTWFITMKVFNDQIWEQIKNGEYKGFSIEAIVDLDEIINNQNINMEKDFLDKLKEIIYEALGKNLEPAVEEAVQEVEEKVEEAVVETPVELDAKDEEIAKLKEDVTNLTAEVERLKAERDELESKLNDAIAEKEAKDKEMEEVKTEMAKLSKQPSIEPVKGQTKEGLNYGSAVQFMLRK